MRHKSWSRDAVQEAHMQQTRTAQEHVHHTRRNIRPAGTLCTTPAPTYINTNGQIERGKQAEMEERVKRAANAHTSYAPTHIRHITGRGGEASGQRIYVIGSERHIRT